MIYITKEKKKEIESKIAEFEFISANDLLQNTERDLAQGSLNIYKEILSETVILPSISDWIEVCSTTDAIFFREKFPNGLIIKP
jgi:hypothetical protein